MTARKSYIDKILCQQTKHTIFRTPLRLKIIREMEFSLSFVNIGSSAFVLMRLLKFKNFNFYLKRHFYEYIMP